MRQLPGMPSWDMISGMPDPAIPESAASTLCKSCGLCCTGHLFSRTKLRAAELNSAQELGLNVFRSHPNERGFSQPCPLWQGQCTVYGSPQYPRYCQTYKCKLLKELLAETTSLPEALTTIEDAKQMIRDLEPQLPESTLPGFRERLEAAIENDELRRQAAPLLGVYLDVFGVDDLVDLTEKS